MALLLLVGVVTCARVLSGQGGASVSIVRTVTAVVPASEKASLLQEHISANCSTSSTKAAICSALLLVHKCSLLYNETSFKNAQNFFFSSILNKL
jgi:hypothetical protein